MIVERTHVLVCEHCTRAFCVPRGDLPEKCLHRNCRLPGQWRVATAAEIERADLAFLRRMKISPE